MTDFTDLADRVGAALIAGGDMLSTAESCTGGGIAQVVTSKAGSSDWFDRGYITYSNEAKREMLGVDAGSIEIHGAVSEQVVREMARGALQGNATVAVAVSGIAGPGGATTGKPVGTVCIGWARRDGPVKSVTRRYSGGRREVREQAIVEALQGVIEILSPP